MKYRCGLRLSLALLMTTLAGCSVYGIGFPGSSPPPRQPAPSYPSEPAVIPPDAGSPSSPDIIPPESQPPEEEDDSTDSSLIGRANAAAAEGDYERALALLERAQRIDPTNADIYLALARTYTAKGDTSQAQATAERGLLYCRNNAQCDQLRVFTE